MRGALANTSWLAGLLHVLSATTRWCSFLTRAFRTFADTDEFTLTGITLEDGSFFAFHDEMGLKNKRPKDGVAFS